MFLDNKYLSLILEILKRIDNDKQKIGADEREKVWFDGWNENLNEFKNSSIRDRSSSVSFGAT